MKILNVLEEVKYKVRYRFQLLTRGWADSDLWNLDEVLSRRTGEMLEAFGRSDGYIAKNGEPVGEEGQELLRHAAALKLYGSRGVWAAVTAEEAKQVTTDAQAAFRYVAEQLPGLWT